MKCPFSSLTNPDTFYPKPPHDWFTHKRQEEPVYWQEDPDSGVGFWVITKHADLEFVSKNPKLFSSAERTSLPQEMDDELVEMQRIMMLNMDPPDHLKYRRIVNKAFVPKVVEHKLSHIRE